MAGPSVVVVRQISIHSPRVRGDLAFPMSADAAFNFYPLPSGEGRPGHDTARLLSVISIHSPRVRGDWLSSYAASQYPISIHSPRVRGDEP